MKLMAEIKRVQIEELSPGSLFIYNDTLALKSEYKRNNGACDCFIVGSGCSFWGGTNSPEELNSLWVYPVVEVPELLVAPYTE